MALSREQLEAATHSLTTTQASVLDRYDKDREALIEKENEQRSGTQSSSLLQHGDA